MCPALLQEYLKYLLFPLYLLLHSQILPLVLKETAGKLLSVKARVLGTCSLFFY